MKKVIIIGGGIAGRGRAKNGCADRAGLRREKGDSANDIGRRVDG